MKLQNKNTHTVDFIRTYSDVLDHTTCQTIIQVFESSDQKERIENDGRPNFTQVNLNNITEINKFVQLLSYRFCDAMRKYKEEYQDFTDWWPNKIFFEQLRVKKYDPDSEDFFNLHVDVQDHDSAKRYLAFLCYLNDDFEGGETRFPYHDLSIAPELGKVLVFPPTWQYPHIGFPVSQKPKYILSTYLHYY